MNKHGDDDWDTNNDMSGLVLMRERDERCKAERVKKELKVEGRRSVSYTSHIKC